MSGVRVIGDIGGTNARFAIGEHGKYSQVQRLKVSDYHTIQAALSEYLKRLPPDIKPTKGAFAVAGPVSSDTVKLTNLDWTFSIKGLKEELGFTDLSVVNDFAGTAMAVPYLPQEDTLLIGPPKPVVKGPIGIIGPGTGLGVSALVPNGDKWILLPGEGGHATMPVATPEEGQVVEFLRRRWEHVSAERALSGAGLVNLYEAICALSGKDALKLEPSQVTDYAMDESNPECLRAFNMFCEILGTVAGNLALTIGATGGVYIAGGILLRFKEAFAASQFRATFEGKGRVHEFVQAIPTYLVLEESPALLGLANLPLE